MENKPKEVLKNKKLLYIVGGALLLLAAIAAFFFFFLKKEKTYTITFDTDGVYPVVASGYRTEQEQQQIYDESMAEYIEKGYSESDAKTETERWVAIPGTSEHQLGLGVDINADGINSYGYEVYNWLAQNAYRYGFIYRYPENKVAITGVANEPWHYRYVGVNAATEIYKRGICLEEYLGETN